ncbi:hypothetical protein GCM10023185_33150 [Hymenobacter saemangeumensis]|uniref:Uncharacterized protein n=1 Tax=Hymenobacter saemangeumensis TaxID=1084522 RepID=A0ABP8INM7_9BACT
MEQPVRFVPVDKQFKKVDRLKGWSFRILLATTVLTPLLTLLDNHAAHPWVAHWYPFWKYVLVAVNCCLIVGFGVLEFVASYQMSNADRDRRLDFLDNAFGTRYSGQTSIGYFTNEALEPGIYKCLVNCFENSSHSRTIAGMMLPKQLLVSLVVLVVFALSAAMGQREIVRLFFELPLPLVLAQDYIRLLIFSKRLDRNHENMKWLFNDMRGQAFNDTRVAAAMRDILDYEAIIAWASIKLETALFDKHWNQLAANWDELKRMYDVRSVQAVMPEAST